MAPFRRGDKIPAHTHNSICSFPWYSPDVPCLECYFFMLLELAAIESNQFINMLWLSIVYGSKTVDQPFGNRQDEVRRRATTTKGKNIANQIKSTEVNIFVFSHVITIYFFSVREKPIERKKGARIENRITMGSIYIYLHNKPEQCPLIWNTYTITMLPIESDWNVEKVDNFSRLSPHPPPIWKSVLFRCKILVTPNYSDRIFVVWTNVSNVYRKV